MAVKRHDKRLELIIDDVQTLDFASSVAALGDVCPTRPLRFPISLVFTGVRDASLNRINRNQKVLPLAWDRFAGTLREYISDEIIHTGESIIEAGLAFWASSHCNYLLLLVEAGDFKVITDGIRSSFAAIFEGNFEDLYAEYWSLRGSGQYVETTAYWRLTRDYFAKKS